MNDKIKVLCVEDETDIRDNLAGILESEDFHVLQAKDGNEGLKMFLEYRPDIVISDIMMPNSTGYDLLKAIRENKDIDNNDVPFILLSALGQREDISKGIDLKASDYMVKPVDFDLLIAKIKAKTSNIKRSEGSKEAEEKNIKNLKSQVSNIIPQEMLQYIDLINKISDALKSEIYGPLPHQKYIEDLNKIYIHSLKLKTIISNFLNSDSISNQLDVQDQIINPLQFIQNLASALNKKSQSKIIIDNQDLVNLPKIKTNKVIMVEIIRNIIGCISRVDDKADINISIAHDPLNRLAIVFYPNQPIGEAKLRSLIEKFVPATMLDNQGLSIEVLFSNDKTNVILLVPNYRVVVTV